MEKLAHTKKDVFKSIARDSKLKDEILQRISAQQAPVGLESFKESVGTLDVDMANDAFNGIDVASPGLEAIILLDARPVLRIRNDDLVEEDIRTETLLGQLAPNRDTIRKVVRSVGRIEVNGHRRLPWVGTGWIIDEDVIVTNRHVAREFGFLAGTKFNFLPGVFGDAMTVRIDFREEHGGGAPQEFSIREILFIEPEGGPDMAFLRVDWKDGSDRREVLPLWEDSVETSRQVAVIDYPAKDSRTNIPNEMDKIFGDIYNVKRFAPGSVIAASKTAGLLTHDCTTLGGNSGSVVLDLASGKAVALHFAGREQEANFAVLAPVIQARLNEVKVSSSIAGLGVIPSNEVAEETPTIDDMEGRKGYDPDFLGKRVDIPDMSPAMKANVAKVEGRNDGILNYTHYSVVMNSKRQMPFYAVVNIDGNQLHRIPRGSDKWFFEPRISPDHQVGNKLYKNNPLDRSHLVRRLDPSWGSNRDVAKLAVEDSFFYTNCSPQHQTLNRNWWLGLEDYIL
ncbi:MAG: DNA/RNA non-specific endonuclease, partial [Planctomycetota bacterium]